MGSAVPVHAALGLLLLVVGLFQVLGLKHKGRHTVLGEAYHWLLLATCAGGMVIGSGNPGLSPFEAITPATYLMGLVGYLAGKSRQPWFGKPWMLWHIAGQGGSYIGVWTAFAFQIVPSSVLPWPYRLWILMSCPSIIGGVLIARTLKRWLPMRATDTVAR